ncbi:MAG: FkbM family methyltransferase, partial [Chloroflexota bacterium]
MRAVVLADNLKLNVNLSELEGGNLYFGIDFEPRELALVKSIVEPGMVFFDVGANIGLYSLVASRLVGEIGVVHTFEPAGFTYETLLTNLRLNGTTNVTA